MGDVKRRDAELFNLQKFVNPFLRLLPGIKRIVIIMRKRKIFISCDWKVEEPTLNTGLGKTCGFSQNLTNRSYLLKILEFCMPRNLKLQARSSQSPPAFFQSYISTLSVVLIASSWKSVKKNFATFWVSQGCAQESWLSTTCGWLLILRHLHIQKVNTFTIFIVVTKDL